MDHDEKWNAQREILVGALRKAALDLFRHSGSTALIVEIPGTNPKLHVAAGTARSIRTLLPSE